MLYYFVRYAQTIKLNLFVPLPEEYVTTYDLTALLKRNADQAVTKRIQERLNAQL